MLITPEERLTQAFRHEYRKREFEEEAGEAIAKEFHPQFRSLLAHPEFKENRQAAANAARLLAEISANFFSAANFYSAGTGNYRKVIDMYKPKMVKDKLKVYWMPYFLRERIGLPADPSYGFRSEFRGVLSAMMERSHSQGLKYGNPAAPAKEPAHRRVIKFLTARRPIRHA